mgnify:CR=1 FL=1
MRPFFKSSFILTGWLFLFVILFGTSPLEANEKVTLQLRWDHQFQFAGYYAAEMQGYYREAGIDVDIRSAIADGKNLIQATKEVASGRADFGIGAAEIIVAREDGADLKVIASIFQRSASRLYLLEKHGPVTLQEVAENLRVARVVNGLVDVEFQAMLRSEGIDPEIVKPYPFETGLDYFIAGEIDVLPGYSLGFPFDAMKREIPYISINPTQYGIDFCGDSLFTRGNLVRENPQVVADFVAASIKGWEYALQNPENVIDYIEKNFPRTFQRDDLSNFNRFQAKQIPALMETDIVPLGYIDPVHWRAMHKALQDAGLAASSFEDLNLIWSPKVEIPKIHHEKIMVFLYLAFSVMAIALIGLFTLYIIKERHKKNLQKSHEELIVSEDRFRKMFKGHSSIMVLVDPEIATVIDANDAAVKFYGYSVEDLKSKYPHDISLHPKDEVTTNIASMVAGQMKSIQVQHQIASGEIKDVEIQASLILEKEKSLLFVTILDVTERNKLMSEQTRSAQLAALGTVAAGVAHEINNPIQGIMNYATLIKNMPESSGRTLEISERMIHESQRIANITRELLDFARDDRNKNVLSDICSLIESSIDLIEKKTLQTGISIERNCAKGLPRLMLYPQGIQQVVVNLIDNASDALNEKEIPISEKVVRVSCNLKDTKNGQMMCLEVADNGVGMSKEVLMKAKETFFSTKPSGQGTGLGLSIVNDIVSRHNGEIDIESFEGEYTKVSVYIPIIESAS